MWTYRCAPKMGVESMNWERFEQLAAVLAEKLAAEGVQVVLGIARAGLFPAAGLSFALDCPLFSISIARRAETRTAILEPAGLPAGALAGKTVGVVDELADSGETLACAADYARRLGAARVITACLVSRPDASPAPDITAMQTEKFIVFPWERRHLAGDGWHMHPAISGESQG